MSPLRRTPLKRGKPVNRVNRARRARLFEEDFGGKEYRDHVASLPCAWCFAPAPSDPHHVKSRGAGGKAEDVVPLCRECHNRLHAKGYANKEQRAYLAARAARIRADFLQRQEDDAT